MKLYEVQPVRYTLRIQDEHKWGLPGIHCDACGATWSAVSLSWPCVDLSGHPDEATLATPHLEEDYNEFLRLRESLLPLVPPGTELKPGTNFGPATGPAEGTTFGVLTMGFPWMMLARPEGLAAMQAEGVRGLKAGLAEFQFKDGSQQVLELQIEPCGHVHADCLPSDRPAPCSACGRRGLPLPEPLMLDLRSLPADRDLFRLADFSQVIVATESFAEAIKRLGCQDLAFLELAAQ